MNSNMKIAFFWFGFNGRYGHWNDGLAEAMRLLDIDNTVKYYDVTTESIENVQKFNPDIILFWEAPITQYGKDADMWFSICALPFKKCLLFAGGPLKAMDVKDFDMVFVESHINAEDCERQGIPYRVAFGVNTDIFYPRHVFKQYDGMHQATCASWKRLDLFAKSLKNAGIVCGRRQATDPSGFDECIKQGVTLMDEQTYYGVSSLLNQSHVMVQTSDYWGGGQRATLEAMACGIPVICMSDSPKNREYVEESGFGKVVEPEIGAIRQAVQELKDNPMDFRVGEKYVESKHTSAHYAISLLNGINEILR